jgi:hypothetical protein
MCIKRGTMRTTLLIFFACLWAVGVVTSDAKATARLRSGIPLLKHLKKGAKAAGKGLANACEAVYDTVKNQVLERCEEKSNAKAEGEEKSDAQCAAKGEVIPADDGFFASSGLGNTNSKILSTACVQVSIPLGPTANLLVAEAGLNFAFERTMDCYFWERDGDKCKHKATGDFAVGIELKMPGAKHGFANVFWQGSVELASDNIKPCQGKDFKFWNATSWECGHFQMLKRFFQYAYTNGGLFESREFTRAAFKHMTRTKGELKAERNKIQADQELLVLVEQLSGTKKDELVPFPPQMHPMYRIGRVYNFLFEAYYKPMLLEAGMSKKRARHPIILNYKKFKASNYKYDNATLLTVEMTIPDVMGVKGVSKEDSTMNYMAGDGGRINFHEYKEDMKKAAQAAEKSKDPNKGINMKERVRRLQLLFVWYARYMLDTAIIMNFGENMERKTTSGKAAKILSGGASTGTNKIALDQKHKTMTMEHCSSLNVQYSGAVPHKLGEKTGFGVGNVGGDHLKDYYFHGEDHTFRGRPRFMCTMAKDISSLNGPNHKGYKHFPRKTCELDMTHSSCTGDGANGCRECKEDEHGKPKRILQCNRLLATSIKYKEELGDDGVIKTCTVGGSELYHPNMIWDEENGELLWEIPLASANMFPHLTKLAVDAMREFRGLRQHLRVFGYKKGDFLKATGIWEKFADKVVGDIETITNDFRQNFGVLDSKAASELCKDWPKGDKTKDHCTKEQSFDKIITGDALRITQGYIDKIDKYTASVEATLETMRKTNIVTEKIECGVTQVLGATFGGFVGFCTADGNVLQVNFARGFSGTLDNTKKVKMFGEASNSVQVVTVPFSGIKIGFAKTYGETPSLTLSLGITPVSKLKGTLSGSNMVENVNHFKNAVTSTTDWIIRFIIPMFANHMATCMAHSTSAVKVMDRASLVLLGEQFLEMALRENANPNSVLGQFKSRKEEDYIHDKFTYAPNQILFGFNFNWKVKCGQGLTLAEYPTLTAKLANTQEMHFGLGRIGAKVSPVVSLGMIMDMGKILNSVMKGGKQFYNRALGKSDKQEDKAAAAAAAADDDDEEVGMVADKPDKVADKSDKVADEPEDFKDKRTVRCVECGKHMDPIFSKGKRRDCKDIQDADEQEECAFVLSDINDFLATTGNKNPGLTVVNLVKNGLQNNNKVKDLKERAEKECKEALGDKAGPYCRQSKICRSIGLSCALPGSFGYKELSEPNEQIVFTADFTKECEGLGPAWFNCIKAKYGKGLNQN